MAHQKPPILVISLLALFLGQNHGMRPLWSVCTNHFVGNCENGLASDDGSLSGSVPNATGVSVEGLYVFFVGEPDGYEGLGEFLFQKGVGDYHLLSPETTGKVGVLKRMGDIDYRTPQLTLVIELSLLSDGASRFRESQGSRDSCIRIPYKSLALHGTERWEIFATDGESVCVQVEDTTSFIPAIVRDVRTLGFDFDSDVRKICYVVRGCSKDPSEVIKLPNTETQGILRRRRGALEKKNMQSLYDHQQHLKIKLNN